MHVGIKYLHESNRTSKELNLAKVSQKVKAFSRRMPFIYFIYLCGSIIAKVLENIKTFWID